MWGQAQSKIEQVDIMTTQGIVNEYGKGKRKRGERVGEEIQGISK